MRFLFYHHNILGPISLEGLWGGTHGFAGSVSRLRILFWLAGRGHEVHLIGNMHAGALRGVRATPGAALLGEHFGTGRDLGDTIVILNDPPEEDIWQQIPPAARRRTLLWAGNPISPTWLARATEGAPLRVICVSQYHRELYRIYRGFERIEVVYSGADLDLMAGAPPAPEARGAVLFCSIPRRTKGFHNLLRAWRSVRQLVPNARLRVCGSERMHDPRLKVGRTGILDPGLETEFPEFFTDPPERHERFGITLLGPRSLTDVYGEMKNAAVVVVNCNWRGGVETFCRTAVEAQAIGVPVVGAASGALPEVVCSGQTGLLVRKSDPRALADALVVLLRDAALRERMGAVGPAWAQPFARFEEVALAWEGVATRALRDEQVPVGTRWCRDALRGLGYGSMRTSVRNFIRGSRLEAKLLKWVGN